MRTPEDAAAERKRVNASLAKIRRAEAAEDRERILNGQPTMPRWDGVERDTNLDLPLRWFVYGFVILMVGMAFILSL